MADFSSQLSNPGALQVVRELKGVSIAGADLVEVSPPLIPTGQPHGWAHP
ncbi:hypothetical protein ACUNV4_00010 [Granulosicoccus sp. 3-233]